MDKKQGISDIDIKSILCTFIINKFLLGDDSKALNEDDSFLEKGIIDSTGVLELVNFIEETFHINVEDEELLPDNLDSINKLVSYIKRKT
jgi:acyl carrier protein